MKQRVINLARGIVRIEVACRYPERFINLCAANEIEFWGMAHIHRPDANTENATESVLRTYLHERDLRRLSALSCEHGFVVTHISKSGAPSLFGKLRRRYILVFGLLFVFLATRALSLFVWDMRISGNEKIPTSVILENLRDLGFSYGTLTLTVHSEELSEQLKLRIPELAWFAVNIRGSRADILIRERIPKPEMIDMRTPAMVSAAKSGVITKISVLEGRAVVAVGDTVLRGETLVTGILDTRYNGVRTTHALAEIEARTWYEMSAQTPVYTTAKRYFDEEKSRFAIIIAGKHINLYFNSGILWSNYDKIRLEESVNLPGGAVLPITLVTERYTRYEPQVVEQSRPILEQSLKDGLLRRLEAAITGGKIIAVSWDTREENGVITVTLNAECLEQIAVSREFTSQELAELTLAQTERTGVFNE